jgi:hypothetical protein
MSLRTLFLSQALLWALLARADYVITSRYAASDCTGEPVPLLVDADPCLPFKDGSWTKLVVCTSATSYNVSTYTNAQCAGIPAVSTPNSDSFSACTYSDIFGAYTKGVCRFGSFDPAPPPPFFSTDLYSVDRGSAGGATCPPTLGSGVQLYGRRAFANTKEGKPFALNECLLADDGTSAFISCYPRYPGSLLIQQYDSSQDCTGEATLIFAGLQNNSNYNAVASFVSKKLPGDDIVSVLGGSVSDPDLIFFLNAGPFCYPPPSPAVASVSTAGVAGIGAAVGLTTAALVLAANFFYQRSLIQRRTPADAAPLLRDGVSMVAR